MSVQHPHTKLINTAARDVLRPIGILRRGRSRVWYDDHGWWAGLIEFQPSSGRRGTYLNVGVQWLWDTAWDSLSAFMYPGGGRSPRINLPGGVEFIEYESDDQFAPLALAMARAAAEGAQHYREILRSVDTAADVLAMNDGVDWDVDAGILFGLRGDVIQARDRFDHYLEWDQSEDGRRWRGDWQDARADRVRALRGCVARTERFRARIAEDVRSVRAAAKLDPDVPLPF